MTVGHEEQVGLGLDERHVEENDGDAPGGEIKGGEEGFRGVIKGGNGGG